MTTVRSILGNLGNGAVLAILAALTAVTSVSSAWVQNELSSASKPDWWVGWLQNFSTEMFGAFLTFLLLELIVQARNQRSYYARQMRSQSPETVESALQELDVHGWLKDGTLRGAVFSQVNLAERDLSKVDLKDVQLEEANLRGANLREARLDRANLRHADLTGVNLFRARLRKADLGWVTMRNASLRAADLEGAFLVGADMRGADLFYANLKGAQLMPRQLEMELGREPAKFDRTTILPDKTRWTPETDMSIFSKPDHPDFWRGWTVIGMGSKWKANLKNANLRGVMLGGRNLADVDLSHADLSGCELAETNLRAANLMAANLYGADLKGADLTDADLSGATLPDGTVWHGNVDMQRFTDPEHPDFWRLDDSDSFAYRGDDSE